MSPREAVDVTSVPSLGASLRRGAARSAALATRRGRHARTVTDLPGLELRADGLHADPLRLTEYQHLVGASATDALPAGFVHVLAFPLATALMVRDDFPLPLVGMVHLANEVTQWRPVRLGEEVEVAVHAERLAAHHRGVSVDVVAHALIGGERVWRGVSTYLAKGYRVAGAITPERVEREFTAPTPTGVWHLPADVGRRYAQVSGDRNPIHTSRLGARAFGFARPIAHGMYTAARALAHLGEPAGAFTWRAEFFAPVALPGTVSVAVGRERDAGATNLVAWGGRQHLRVEVTSLGQAPARGHTAS